MKLRTVLISLVVCIPVCTAETAPEAVVVDPNGHRIVLENAYVRVLELRAEPGYRIHLHTHPSHAVVVLSGARVRLTRRDGTSELVDRKPGDVFWSEAEEHSLEVVAGSLHEIDTEIKGGVPPPFAPSAKDVTEITPELARVVHEDPHLRVLDLRGEPGQQFPFHFHRARVTIRLGSARMRFVEKNGTTRMADFHPGEATWGDAVEHSDAVMSGSFHLVLVEIKGQPPTGRSADLK
jgi:quercetin dioxygenase-like cupin family protein